ncbi:MAG: hypothetical protein DI527_00540 [Chelatococcus sp.]|nr:MAG: hypothetical protein DI527_00540 [Chelatococcus sp.]
MVSFFVGQSVVCVDGDFSLRLLEQAGIWSLTLPARDKVYTIRDIEERHGVIGIRLAEIVNPAVEYTAYPGLICEPSFLAWRFRPLVETDISVLTALLNPAPAIVRELEDA